MKTRPSGTYLDGPDEVHGDPFIKVTVGGVQCQNPYNLQPIGGLVRGSHAEVGFNCRLAQCHLLAGEGSAGLNESLCIRLRLFPSLQQLNRLDEGLQCCNSVL